MVHHKNDTKCVLMCFNQVLNTKEMRKVIFFSLISLVQLSESSVVYFMATEKLQH